MRARPGEATRAVADVLAEYLKPPPWHAEASCRGAGVDVFFVERGQSTEPAKAICSECTVQTECADYAASGHDVSAGIWAGVSVARLRKTT